MVRHPSKSVKDCPAPGVADAHKKSVSKRRCEGSILGDKRLPSKTGDFGGARLLAW